MGHDGHGRGEEIAWNSHYLVVSHKLLVFQNTVQEPCQG
jgi:hypothetical protein